MFQRREMHCKYNSLDFEKYRRLAREENGTIHIRTVNCLVISKLH